MDTTLNADKLPHTVICIKNITSAQPRQLPKKRIMNVQKYPYGSST